jgi:uncharacterized membrane protein YfcA
MGEEVQCNAILLVAATLGQVAGNLAIDQLMAESGSFALSGLMSLIAQYLVTRFALDRAGLLPEGAPSRFGSLWGLNIVAGLASLVGLLLLILPGVYLNARWLMAAPIIIADDKAMSEGMSESWERTRDSAWPIVGALLALYGCGFGLGMVPFFLSGEENPPTEYAAAGYLFFALTSTLGWLMAVGAYRLMSSRTQSLEEIFA